MVDVYIKERIWIAAYIASMEAAGRIYSAGRTIEESYRVIKPHEFAVSNADAAVQQFLGSQVDAPHVPPMPAASTDDDIPF